MQHKTQNGVIRAIQAFLDKGSQILYDKYLITKIPIHSTKDITNILTLNNNCMIKIPDKRVQQKQSNAVKNIKVDTLTMCNIPIKIKSNFNNRNSKSYEYQTKNNNNGKQQLSTIYHKTNNKISLKPQYCFKNQCYKYDDNQQQIQTLRTYKIIKDQTQKRQKQTLIVQGKKIQQRRLKLSENFEHIRKQNQLFTYDYQQPQIIPNISSIEQKKVLQLRYQTVDFSMMNRQPQISTIQGKKVGLYTNRIKKKQKQKLSNKQYNNNGRRQYSTIPYINLKQGVKVKQAYLKVVAMRQRSPQTTKFSYESQNANKRFRSFMPSKSIRIAPVENTMMNTIDNLMDERPSTTNYTCGKRTAATTTRSLLWRPKTTSTNHRVKKINNDLVNEMIQQNF